MFIYKFTSEKYNKQLVEREMQAIFNLPINSEWIISEQDITPNKSYFLNYRIKVIANASCLENLAKLIKTQKLYFEDFKVEFIDVKSDILQYDMRINYCRLIADMIDGTCKMIKPSTKVVVTFVNGLWYAGILEKNDRSFETLQNKPHSYSHSLSAQLARTLVNILCAQNKPTIIDPCCGIGTVVIDALSQGYDITGTELVWLVANKAKQNLEHFNLNPVITCQDMHQIKTKYDLSILDLPYGLMSQTTPKLQTELITSCYNFSNQLMLITNEDSVDLIANTNWKISEMIEIPKANYMFTRYMYILVK